MIKIVFEGKCENCLAVDLEIDRVENYFTGEKYWTVKCIHESACARMQAKQSEQVEGD